MLFSVNMLILNYFINKDKLLLNNNAREIYNVLEKLKHKSKEEYENGIWNFIENNNLHKIGISNNNNRYKTSYPISNVF